MLGIVSATEITDNSSYNNINTLEDSVSNIETTKYTDSLGN